MQATKTRSSVSDRVPCLVVSLYARRDINHISYSLSSLVNFHVMQFGLKRWNAPALQPGDLAGDMSKSFDVVAPPRLAVPSQVPT